MANQFFNPKESEAKTRVPLSLCPPVALIHMAAVFREGCTRVGRWAYNWRFAPTSMSKYLDALERHTQALKDGEWLDPKSGFPHLAHIMSNAAIMLDAKAAGTLVEDMPKVTTGVSALLKHYSDLFQKQSSVDPVPSEPVGVSSVYVNQISAMKQGTQEMLNGKWHRKL